MGNVSVPIDGDVLRRLRADKMWSYARLAKEARDAAKQLGEHSSLGPPTLWRAENDQHQRLSRNNLRYVVGALRPSLADLRRLLLGTQPPGALVQLCSDATGQAPAEQDPAILTAVAAQLDEILAEVRALASRPSVGAASRKGADLDRTVSLHKFLPGLLGAVVVLWAAVERLSDARHAGVDDTLVAAYEDIANPLWQAYMSTSKREHLLVVVGQQAATVRDVLRQPMTDSQRRRLYEVSVGLHAESGFRAALEQAYQEFGRIDGSETGFSAQSGGFLTPWLLHATAGMGHMVLAHNSKALREFRAAVRDPAINPRSAVDLRADMTRVWMQLDEPEQTCAQMTAALKATEAIGGHPMGIQRIRRVRASFPKPWADLDCVRELDQRLHAAA